MTTKGDVQALLLFLHNAFIAETQTASFLEAPEQLLRLPSRKAIESLSMASVTYLKDL